MEADTGHCSICLRPWTSTGGHQVCCLRCGHLYGHDCILTWLNRASRCPECNARWTSELHKQLHVHYTYRYATHLFALLHTTLPPSHTCICTRLMHANFLSVFCFHTAPAFIPLVASGASGQPDNCAELMWRTYGCCTPTK